MTEIRNIYQKEAEDYLHELLDLKERQASIEKDLKLVQHKLSVAFASGDLNHLKIQDRHSSLKYHDSTVTFNPGRESYDYSKCDEIRLKEAELKVLKKTAQSVGLAPKKSGTPFWTIRS